MSKLVETILKERNSLSNFPHLLYRSSISRKRSETKARNIYSGCTNTT